MQSTPKTAERSHASRQASFAPVSPLRLCARLGAILLAGIVLGYLLLMLAYAIPADAMLGKLRESAAVFDPGEGKPEAADETLVRGYPSTWLDNATDIRFLLHAAYSTDEPLSVQALRVPWHTSGTLMDSLLDYTQNGAEHMETLTYGRYWHGYLILLKPMLLLFSYGDIRMLNLLVQGGLCMLLFWLMARRGLGRYAPALGCALLCLTPFVLPLCMQYAVVFTITLVAMCVLLLWPDRWLNRSGGAVLFLMTGMATSYFDLLTYPLLALGLPLALYLLLAEERGGKRFLTVALGMGAAWLLGYAGLWAGKWLLIALSGDAEGLRLVGDTISLRMSDSEVTRLSAIQRNISVLWRKPYKLMGMAAIIAVAVAWLRSRRFRALAAPALMAALLALAALPFAWYLLLPNHSHIHYFYTHRILAVSVFAALCLAIRLCKRREPAEKA